MSNFNYWLKFPVSLTYHVVLINFNKKLVTQAVSRMSGLIKIQLQQCWVLCSGTIQSASAYSSTPCISLACSGSIVCLNMSDISLVDSSDYSLSNSFLTHPQTDMDLGAGHPHRLCWTICSWAFQLSRAVGEKSAELSSTSANFMQFGMTREIF